jgi:adenylate cyclase class 2
MLEAEVKIALDAASRARLEQRLAEIGAEGSGQHHQTDAYFAHPVRDFAATDEALRLRQDDGALRMTYKGPKLDPPRKTREEIEFGLDTDVATAAKLLARLGFREVAVVRKRRSEYAVAGDPPASVAIDDVEGLGAFCEIEVRTDDVAAGRCALDAALARLGLAGLPLIAESYLELFLSRR